MTKEKGCYFCVKKNSCEYIKSYKMKTVSDFQYEDLFNKELGWIGSKCFEFVLKKPFVFR